MSFHMLWPLLFLQFLTHALSQTWHHWSYFFSPFVNLVGLLKPQEFLFPTPVRDVFTYLVTLLLILQACGFKYVSVNISTIILGSVDLFDSYFNSSQTAGLFLVEHQWLALLCDFLNNFFHQIQMILKMDSNHKVKYSKII